MASRKSNVAVKHDTNVEKIAAKETTTAKRVSRERAWATVEAASKRNVESVAKQAQEMKLRITNVLDTVTNEVAGQLTILTETQEAVATVKGELTELHQIAAIAGSLEALQLAKAELDEELANTQVQFDLNMETAKKLREQERTREQKEFEYTRTITRRVENDAWVQEKARREADFAADLAKRSADIDARFLVIQAAETELVKLRERVAGFDKELVAAVGKAEGMTKHSVTRDLTHTHQMELAGEINKRTVLEGQVRSLTEKVVDLTTSNKLLVDEARQANIRVQAISEKAIEGAAREKVVVNTTTSNDGGAGVRQRG